jgi:hypothetical protein
MHPETVVRIRNQTILREFSISPRFSTGLVTLAVSCTNATSGNAIWQQRSQAGHNTVPHTYYASTTPFSTHERPTMESHIVSAMFDDYREAASAVGRLEVAGIRPQDISLVGSNGEMQRAGTASETDTLVLNTGLESGAVIGAC